MRTCTSLRYNYETMIQIASFDTTRKIPLIARSPRRGGDHANRELSTLLAANLRLVLERLNQVSIVSVQILIIGQMPFP